MSGEGFVGFLVTVVFALVVLLLVARYGIPDTMSPCGNRTCPDGMSPMAMRYQGCICVVRPR